MTPASREEDQTVLSAIGANLLELAPEMGIFGGFEQRFSPKSLRSIFVEEVMAKPTVGVDRMTPQKFREDLDENVAVISRKALDGSYHFTNYRQKLISKGAEDKPRQLCIATVRDKLVLKALSHVLDDAFGTDCKTPIPRKVVDDVAEAVRSEENDYAVRCDIKGFYQSINHEKLLQAVGSRIEDERVIDLIGKCISTPTVEMGHKASSPRTLGVPEGLPVSNRLANILMISLDREMATLSDVKAFRYVDDIVIVGPKESVIRAREILAARINELGLELHGEGSGKVWEGFLDGGRFDYLGYTFDGRRLFAGEKTRRKLERSLEEILKKLARNPDDDGLWEELNARITGCRIFEGGKVAWCVGWLFYYSGTSDAAYMGRLDSLVKKMAARMGLTLRDDVKSFKRAYYEIRHRGAASRYILSNEFAGSPEEQRSYLEAKRKIGTSRLSDDEVGILYTRIRKREIEDLAGAYRVYGD